jgi:hypothetical protein
MNSAALTKISVLAMIAPVLVLFLGCATVTTTPVNAVRLKSIHTIRVEPLPNDQHGIDKLIAADLKSRGFEVLIGNDSEVGSNSGTNCDATLSYQDRWAWDLSMYMLSLDAQLRNGKTRVILGQGQTYCPSLQRQTPEVMVHTLLDQVIGVQPANKSTPPLPSSR